MAGHVTYEFGGFRFEPEDLRLVYGDRVIPLTGKAADTLLVLVQHPDSVVSKEALFAAVWPGVAVEDNNLNQQISALRKALTQNGGTEFIETVSRRGYRFVGPAREVGSSPSVQSVVGNGESRTVSPAPLPVAPVDQPARGRPTVVASGFSRTVVGRVAAIITVLIALATGVGFGWQWQQSQRAARESQAAVGRANELMRRADGPGAVAELQLAIQLNPRNAEAYATLAHALNRQRSNAAAPREPGRSASVEAARRAVALDPGCGHCQGTLGLFLFTHDWEWTAAEGHLREAIRLDPERPGIRPSHALLLAATGRTADALEQIDFALEKLPYEIGWHAIRASIFYLDRRYPEAIAAADQALTLSSSDRSAWEWRSKALFQMGRGKEAIHALAQDAFASYSAELDQAVRNGATEGGLRKLLAITDDWRGRVDHAWRRGPWRTLLKDTEGAFEELERAYEVRSFNLIYVGVDPVYDGIRADPRFQRLLTRMGLDAVLKSHPRALAGDIKR